MTTTEKLEALVQRAVDMDLDLKQLYFDMTEGGLINSIDDFMTWLRERANNNDKLSIIFNHAFARALFGEQDVPCRCTCDYPEEMLLGDGFREHQPEMIHSYLYHLQQAVVSDDPIDYMYRAVFGDE